MKRLIWIGLFGLTGAGIGTSCTPLLPNDCEFLRSCPEDASGGEHSSGDGDGDTSSGGTGGDGGTSSGGAAGDGDGDTTSGSGGTIVDPCDACEGETPVCVDDECVACSDQRPGICQVNEHCSEENECVECLGNTHCTEADASSCDVDTNSCTGCSENTDCEHLTETPFCNTDNKICVECTVEDDDRSVDTDTCGSGVCDPLTLSCNTDTTQASKDLCSACTADNECLLGQNCIPLFYKPEALPEVPLGGFCMKLYPGCTPPYQAGALRRASLSGAAPTDYCGLAENFTSCAAIKDLEDGKLCSESSQCGTANGEGVCDIVNGGADTQCSYSCTSSNQCVSGNACGGVSGSKYCGG